MAKTKRTPDMRAYQKVKVYTKTGDKGLTSLFGGQRVPKYSLRVETYGTVDELNSAIGVCLTELKKKHKEVRNELIHIQHDLFETGASLANPNQKPETAAKNSAFLSKRATTFETVIDKMAIQIPDFQCFILPGGVKASAHLHVCRTIARRAERRIVELSQKEKIDNAIIIYFNRLSDLLFTMARFVNFKEKKKETIWEQQM